MTLASLAFNGPDPSMAFNGPDPSLAFNGPARPINEPGLDCWPFLVVAGHGNQVERKKQRHVTGHLYSLMM